MAMQQVTYLAGGLPGVLLSGGLGAVFLYGGFRYLDRTLSMGTLVAFHGLPDAADGAGAGADGASTRASPRPRSRWRASTRSRMRRSMWKKRPGRRRPPTCAGSWSSTGSASRSTAARRPWRTCLVHRGAGGDRGHRRPQRRREVDRGRPAPPLVRSRPGRGPAGRTRPAGAAAGLSPPARGAGGARAVSSSTRRWPRTFVTRGRRQASARWRRRRARAGIHDFNRRAPGGLRNRCGRAGGGAVGGGAAARRHRPRAARRPDRAGARRGDRPRWTRSPSGRVVDGYEALMRERTTLLITHRLGLARRADRVVALDGARVAEIGSPDGAAGTRRGIFARLFRIAGRAGAGERVGRQNRPRLRTPGKLRRPAGDDSMSHGRAWAMALRDWNPACFSRSSRVGVKFQARSGDVSKTLRNRSSSGSSTAASMPATRTSARFAAGAGFDAEGKHPGRHRRPPGPRHGGRRRDPGSCDRRARLPSQGVRPHARHVGRGARRGHRLGGATQAAAGEPQPGYERPLARRRTHGCRRACASSRVPSS